MLNRTQKSKRQVSSKTKAVKKRDTGVPPDSREVHCNRLGIPKRRQEPPEDSNPKPTAPYPEKGSPIWFVLILFALFFQASDTAAQTLLLSDANSSVNIDSGSQSGVDSWTVDGQNQLNTEWFWYRIGSSGTAASIDTISTPTVSHPAAGLLSTTYQNNQFSLQVVYSLVGGAPGSGVADLSEQIRIQNLTAAPLAFNFFQYSDFSLAGGNNQNVQLGENLQGKYNEALVTGGSISTSETLDTALSPGANHGEAALSNSTLANLQNTAGYNLNDNTTAGPGNATWALEWNKNIAANGSLTISEDLNVTGVSVSPVPEPPVWSVLSIGLLGFGAMKRYLARRW